MGNYRKALRFTKSELEETLDIPESDYVELIDVYWDNIGQEWVFDCCVATGGVTH